MREHRAKNLKTALEMRVYVTLSFWYSLGRSPDTVVRYASPRRAVVSGRVIKPFADALSEKVCIWKIPLVRSTGICILVNGELGYKASHDRTTRGTVRSRTNVTQCVLFCQGCTKLTRRSVLSAQTVPFTPACL